MLPGGSAPAACAAGYIRSPKKGRGKEKQDNRTIKVSNGNQDVTQNKKMAAGQCLRGHFYI